MKIGDYFERMSRRPDIIHHSELAQRRLLAKGAKEDIEFLSKALPELVKKGDVSAPTAKQFSSLFPTFQKVLQQLQWEVEYTIERRREKNDW